MSKHPKIIIMKWGSFAASDDFLVQPIDSENKFSKRLTAIMIQPSNILARKNYGETGWMSLRLFISRVASESWEKFKRKKSVRWTIDVFWESCTPTNHRSSQDKHVECKTGSLAYEFRAKVVKETILAFVWELLPHQAAFWLSLLLFDWKGWDGNSRISRDGWIM